MAKPSLKSIFSSPLVLVTAVRKIKVDGFFGGIVFGALFSMLVNLVTVQVQEMISRQRILEAVEWEIYNNLSQAKSVDTNVARVFENKEDPNPFFTFSKYTRDLWEQSTEPLQYIAQLSSETQAKVVVYYTVTVKGHNELIESLEKYSDSYLRNCFEVTVVKNAEERNECKVTYYQLLNSYADTADAMFKSSMEVLDVFHPTEDRLNNRFLRFMMGNKSVRVLSRK